MFANWRELFLHGEKTGAAFNKANPNLPADGNALPTDLELTVRESESAYIFTKQTACYLILSQDDPFALIRERQLFADKTFVPKAKHIPQSTWLNVHRPVQVVNAT